METRMDTLKLCTLPAVSACRAGLFIALSSFWYELVGSLVLISGPDIYVDGSDVLPAV